MVKEKEPNVDPPKKSNYSLMSKGRALLLSWSFELRKLPLISFSRTDFCFGGGELWRAFPMLLVITVFRVHVGRNTIKIRTVKGTREHEATSLSVNVTSQGYFPHGILKVLNQKKQEVWD